MSDNVYFRVAVLWAIILSAVGCNRTERQIEVRLPARVSFPQPYDFLLYMPNSKELAETKSKTGLPVLLFLHGTGERGTDLNRLKRTGIPELITRGQNFPFLVVSPQSIEYGWEPDRLVALLDYIESHYEVDQERIYVTGLSMGGYGAWELAQVAGDRLAAIVPICGGGDPAKATVLKDLPIWVFHGARDEVVSIEESEVMVDSIKKAGGNIRFTVFPNAKHNSWTKAYSRPDLYEWLLKHKKSRGEQHVN